MTRSLQELHEQAIWNEGRDCVCDTDGPDLCEAMQWARHHRAPKPPDGQMHIGQVPPRYDQMGPDDDWPEGY